MKQILTATTRERKPLLQIIVKTYTEINLMIATEVFCTAEQMVTEEISTLVTNSLDRILRYTYGEATHGSLLCRL